MSNVHPISTEKKPTCDKLFHKVEGLQVILFCGGIYKQADLYRKYIADDDEHRLFAKQGGGFISLCGHGGTSHRGTTWLEIEADDGAVLCKGKLGRPCYNPKA